MKKNTPKAPRKPGLKYCPKCSQYKLRAEFPAANFKDGTKRVRGYCNACHYKPIDTSGLNEPTNVAGLPSNEYFAGHFDGEGSVIMYFPHNTTRPILKVSVSGCHLPTLELYKLKFGGGITIKRRGGNGYKTNYTWQLTTMVACLRFLRAVAPYCIEKKERIDLGVEWLEYRITLSQSSNSKEAGDKARQFTERIRALKNFDYPVG